MPVSRCVHPPGCRHDGRSSGSERLGALRHAERPVCRRDGQSFPSGAGRARRMMPTQGLVVRQPQLVPGLPPQIGERLA